MKRKLMLLMTCLMIGIGLVNAQISKVTGNVTSEEDGLPVVGASVLVKGTTVGTVTDIDGNFTLTNVPSSAGTLVISFIGMQSQEVKIKSHVKVVLKSDAEVLDEVVVTAAGIKRSEKSLGYAVSQVSADDVIVAGEPDMLKALQGKVAGVDIRSSQGGPGSATKINIRGASSFFGDNEPLIIVDGVPLSNQQITTSNQTSGGSNYSGGLSSIDPNDIASMSVLKGSAAAAMYGSRASNGVVIIKTKSGSTTSGEKRFGVTLNSSLSFENIANLPEYQNTYGPGFAFKYSNSNGSWGPRFDSMEKIPAWEDYLNAFPELFPEDGMIPYEAVPNNVKDLFQTGHIYDNSVNLSGGNEKSAFNATLSHMKHEGYIPNSGYKRVAMSVGGSTKLGNGINLRGNISYTNTDQKGGMYGENQVSGAASSFARTLFLGRNWDLTKYPYETPDGKPVSTLTSQYDNPLWSWKHNVTTTEADRIIGSIGLDYDVTDWFNISYTIGTNVYSMYRKEVIDIGSRAAEGKGQLTDHKARTVETESTLLLTFEKDFFEDYSVKAILGHNANERKRTETLVVGTEFKVPNIYNLANTKNQVVSGDYYEKRRLMGVFFDLTLGYKSWAFLGFTARNDWSSTLPKNHRSYFYPAVTGSFVFSDAFNLQSNMFNFGKIRVGWAKVGRDADPYYLYNVYALGDPFRGQTITAASSSAGNNNLKPEFTEEVEVGTQLDFFNRRLSLDFTWYNKISTNLIAPVQLPNSSGFVEIYDNFGKIRNRGIEIGLRAVPVEIKDFKWEVGVNFTKNKNEVLELKEGVERIALAGVLTDLAPYAEVGKPFGYLRGTKDLRDEQGNLLIDPSTGLLIQDPEQDMIGDPNPDFQVGINTNLSYKGFFLSAQFDWTQGGDIASSTINSYLGRGVTKDTEDREHVVVIPGYYGDPNTGKPLLDAAGNKIPNSTRVIVDDLYFGESFGANSAREWQVYDATVYRLRELTFGYNFPKKWFKNTPIGSLMLSVSGNNLWYFAPNVPRYTNFDPAVNSFGTTSAQGIELAAAPTARRWTVNLKVTF